MDRRPGEIAEIVRERFAEELSRQRLRTDDILGAGDDSLNREGSVISVISGPAVDTDGVYMDARMTWSTPVSKGTFDSNARIRQFSVWINTRHPYEKNPDGVAKWVPAPVRETDGWALAMFGPSWGDYAYRVHTLRGELGRWPQLYIVFVDHDGRPVLAPNDYRWEEAGVGGPAYPHKLAPRPENTDLIKYLKQKGDCIIIQDGEK